MTAGIQDVSSGANYETTGPRGNNQNLGQQDFLRLMVAQVQNQDPLEPKTNGDFLAQLAQFSTNDGINNMQESLKQLSASLQSNQTLQASSLVGRKVLVNTDKMSLPKEGEVKAAVDIPAGVNHLVASVYSKTGELVRTIQLGQTEPGQHDFTWDGMNEQGQRAEAGQYNIKVTAQYNGKEVPLRTLVAAQVDSVSLGGQGDGVKLQVAGIGSVYLTDVRQISN